MAMWNPWRGCHRHSEGCRFRYIHNVYLCFSTDFLIEAADEWRSECWQMMRERCDLHFLFLTKRIERFMDCIPEDWNDGYDNVTVGCTVENQDRADYRLSIFGKLPVKHKNIVCQPLIEEINLSPYLNMEKITPCPHATYAARPERQISIIDQPPLFFVQGWRG